MKAGALCLMALTSKDVTDQTALIPRQTTVQPGKQPSPAESTPRTVAATGTQTTSMLANYILQAQNGGQPRQVVDMQFGSGEER